MDSAGFPLISPICTVLAFPVRSTQTAKTSTHKTTVAGHRAAGESPPLPTPVPCWVGPAWPWDPACPGRGGTGEGPHPCSMTGFREDSFDGPNSGQRWNPWGTSETSPGLLSRLHMHHRPAPQTQGTLCRPLKCVAMQ